MYGHQIIFVLTTLIFSSITAMVITNNDDNGGACEVRNQLIAYDINGHISTINVPECVVSTAYVIRSTITTNPQDQARFVEINNGCCCEVARYTKRQIRIGNTIHKYNEIESCACRECPVPSIDD